MDICNIHRSIKDCMLIDSTVKTALGYKHIKNEFISTNFDLVLKLFEVYLYFYHYRKTNMLRYYGW